MLPHIIPFNIALKVPANKNKPRKKGIRLGRKMSSFINDMIISVKNQQELINNIGIKKRL
jgi:hypothetical protein